MAVTLPIGTASNRGSERLRTMHARQLAVVAAVAVPAWRPSPKLHAGQWAEGAPAPSVREAFQVRAGVVQESQMDTAGWVWAVKTCTTSSGSDPDNIPIRRSLPALFSEHG